MPKRLEVQHRGFTIRHWRQRHIEWKPLGGSRFFQAVLSNRPTQWLVWIDGPSVMAGWRRVYIDQAARSFIKINRKKFYL